MAATHLSKYCSLIHAAVALLSAASIAAGENYNPTTTPSHNAKPAYNNGHVSTPALDNLKSRMHQYEQRRNQEPEAAKPEYGFPVGVEGVVACKSGSGYYRPIKGATVRISCLVGEEEEHKVLCSTDERGYFYKAMPAYGGRPEMCKAYLEKSGLEECSEPSDVNKGVNGAVLSSYKILHGKRIKLYSVGPFFYTVKKTAAPEKPYSSKSPAGY